MQMCDKNETGDSKWRSSHTCNVVGIRSNRSLCLKPYKHSVYFEIQGTRSEVSGTERGTPRARERSTMEQEMNAYGTLSETRHPLVHLAASVFYQSEAK